MPRIDPLSLLKCLSVLLGPNGGIKSKEEVTRLANLMTKFSKKLVSKCIYIQILKNTEPVLLDLFMAHGGWNLIHMWLTDGILAKNWALIQELLELLLLCPVDTNRLKSNHCPKLIKGLSKEGSHQGVRTLASKLVEQWLKMVKGEATPSAEAIQANAISGSTPVQSMQSNASITPITSQGINSENAVTVHTSDSPIQNTPANHSFQELLKNTASPKTSQINNSQTTTSVYKITIRDGKQVLTQVQTDAANINNVMCVNNLKTEINGDVVDQVLPMEDDSSKFAKESESSNQRTSSINKNNVDSLSSEVKEIVGSQDETDNVKSKDRKNEKDVGSDGSKSTSDKENRDKKDDKKSSSSSADKKSSHSQSSSKSSSKHSSSSSKHSSSSSKHSSSSHRSSSKSSSSSRDKSSRDKDKDRHHSSSSSKSSSSSSKSKSERDKEKEREKEKQKKDQAERDKAALEKIQGPSLSSKIGKIPKKKSDEEKSEDSSKKSSTDSKDSKDKKLAAVAEKKKISISIENRKNPQDSTSRPKTVKTYNSKFRSTGLEEEVAKPPPPRGSKKPTSVPDKKIIPPKIPLKRTSPIKETGPLDKKAKLALDSPPMEEKKGGIKLIPPKPKLMFLQESDMFMDALTASTKSKEPRKRKRRASLTKDSPSDTKKSESAQENHTSSPPASPTSPPNTANNKDANDKPVVVEKPSFKFYQDTLETDDEKEDKNKSKTDDDSAKDTDVEMEDAKTAKTEDDEDHERSRTPTPENDFDEEKGPTSPEDPAAAVSEALSKEESLEARPIGGVLKSVLLLQKRKGPKKSLKWKTDLESIRYFELDETERVNVTKTSFTDMKQMEKMNEREAFQMARKLSSEDVMEEKTLWKPLIPIDTDPPLVEPGKDSREKDIQYAREKGILQALYFHRGMIPDSPAEPDEERHHIYIEPKLIPLDDLTGNKESEKDYSNTPWPEPKPQPPVTTPSVPSPFFQTFRNNQPPIIPPVGIQPQMNSMPPSLLNSMTSQMPPEMPNSLAPVTGGGGGGWRTGDGKIVVPDPSITPMPTMNPTYPQGLDGPPMAPPNMMGPTMYNQDGYAMPPEDMNFNNYQGPPGPNMFGPGPGGPPSSGPPFQGPRGPPMHGNRGRGGPGWFRGGPPRGMPWRGGWRGSGKQPPVCRQFKAGFCRVGDKCQFLHPGQNCPPF